MVPPEQIGTKRNLAILEMEKKILNSIFYSIAFPKVGIIYSVYCDIINRV